MILAHPAKYWAKFYITRRQHSYEQICNMLRLFGLSGYTADDLETLELSMEFPEDFRPKDLRHRDSVLFLRQEGVYEAWHRNAHMAQALQVLEHSRVRHTLEALILSPLTVAQVVRKVHQKTGFSLTHRACELFEHYFWNKRLLSGVEWGKFIRTRDDDSREWLSLAVNAKDAAGVQTLFWKMGLGSMHQLEAYKIFSDFRNMAYGCAKQIEMDTPGREHAAALLGYARVAKIGQEGVESTADAVHDVVESFNAFRLQQREINTPSVDQLTNGNFSEAETASDEGEDIGDY